MTTEPMADDPSEPPDDEELCEICGNPISDADPWVRGLTGGAAHNRCLPGIGDLLDD